MAFTEIFRSNYSGDYGYLYELMAEATEETYSIANNTSRVAVYLYLRRTNSSANGAWNNDGTAWSITIDGEKFSGTSAWDTRNTSGWQLLGGATKTITHEANGKKTITISASHTGNRADGNSKMGNASGSGTFKLTDIPRYATVNQSLNTKTTTSIKMNWSSDSTIDYIWYSKDGGSNWTAVGSVNGTSGSYTITGLSYNTSYSIKTRVRRKDSQLTTDSGATSITTFDIARISEAPNVNIGSAHTIKWSNPSGESLKLKLCKTDGTTVIDYGTVTGTSKTVTPTAATIYALTPNSNSITLRYVLSTGSVGSSSKDSVFTVASGSSNPTFSAFTYADVNSTTTALTGNNQIIVKGYSNVVGTITTANKAVAKNSATMKKYQMTIGSKSKESTYSSSATVNVPSSGSLTGADGATIEMYALDSRGNSTKVTKTATLKDYSAIKIASLTATRTGGVGTETTLKFSAKYWNQSFGNVPNKVKSCTYRYKLTNTSQYTEGATTLTYNISGNTITGSVKIKGDLGADGFSVANSFNIQLVISDELTTAYADVILSSGTPAIAIYKDNVAIGKKYDKNLGGKLQVAGDIKARGVNCYKTGTIQGAAWVYIGDFGFDWQGAYADLECFLGNGQNGNADQNTHAKILLKQGWTEVASGLPIGVTTQFTQNASSNVKVKIKHISVTQCKVYIYLPWSYNDLTYIVNGSYKTFNPINNIIIEEPSTDKESAYYWTAAQGIYNKTTAGDLDWVSGEEAERNLITKRALANYNGAYNGTSSHLTYCYQGTIQAKPTTLYNNTSGTTGTVTLSQSSAGFNYLEIYYSKNGSFYNCTKVSAPNGKKVCLDLSYYDAANNMHQLATKIISISGTSITVVTNNTGLTNFQFNNVNSLYNSNELTIHKVLGYK